jgi:hypothetical protein
VIDGTNAYIEDAFIEGNQGLTPFRMLSYLPVSNVNLSFYQTQGNGVTRLSEHRSCRTRMVGMARVCAKQSFIPMREVHR